MKKAKLYRSFLQKTLFLCIFPVLFWACETDLQEVNKVTHVSGMPDMWAKNIEIIYSDSGRVMMKTFAPELKVFERNTNDPYSEFPQGVSAIFYETDGTVKSSLEAKYAKYHKRHGLWEARNDVELVNAQGDILNSEHLFFDERKQTIYTDKFVQITNAEGWKINGEGGFESNIDFTQYKFKIVSGIFTVQENE